MIPAIPHGRSRARARWLPAAAASALLLPLLAVADPATPAPSPAAAADGASAPTGCLDSGDGYFRAHVSGAIEARIDWPNNGTQCQGEPKSAPPGVRLSFQRIAAPKRAAAPDLLFVFGLTGIREGRPARAAGANLTVIVQGTPKIFGTLGDARCTVDSLTQRRLPAPGSYRVEARGFCTQPARAVRGNDEVLVRTFEFAGLVNYGAAADATVPAAPGRTAMSKVPLGRGTAID